MLYQFARQIFCLAVWMGAVNVASAEINLLVDVGDGRMSLVGNGESILGFSITSPGGHLIDEIPLSFDDNFVTASSTESMFFATARGDIAKAIEGEVSILARYDVSGERDLLFRSDNLGNSVLYVPEPRGGVGWIGFLILIIGFAKRSRR
jgi:hypothetical protein